MLKDLSYEIAQLNMIVAIAIVELDRIIEVIHRWN